MRNQALKQRADFQAKIKQFELDADRERREKKEKQKQNNDFWMQQIEWRKQAVKAEHDQAQFDPTKQWTIETPVRALNERKTAASNN